MTTAAPDTRDDVPSLADSRFRMLFHFAVGMPGNDPDS
jgi:hypothetical protein